MTQHRYRDEDIPLTQEQREMVASNLGLIGMAMKRWPHLVRLLGRDEAQTIAEDALCVAVKRHDGAVSKWSTYAVCYIRGYWLTEITRRAGHRPLVVVAPDVLVRAFDRPGDDQDVACGLERQEEIRQRQDLVLAVRERMQRMPQRQQDAIELCIVQGMTTRAAAQELGITKNAVQEPLLAGLQRLRKMLAHLQPQQQEGQ